MTRAAPLPGVLIFTTTPPLYLPALLLSSHIRHPLKENYPSLLADHWATHLAQHGIDATPALSDPIVWLKSVPSFPDQDDDGGTDADESHDGQKSEDESEDDELDQDGNVWRGVRRSEAVAANNGPSRRATTSGNEGQVVANVTIGQVTYLAPVPPGTDPMLPLSFLHHLHSVLSSYFPATSSSHTLAASPNAPVPIPASVLTSNFDLLYQVLQEMLDDGRPLTTEYNSIKGVVRGRAWWEDLIGRMSSLTSSNPPPPPQISPLPWRPAQVRYTRNEVYIDVVESLNGIIDRKGNPVGGLELTVSVTCKTKLSGTPDLTLGLHPSASGPSSPYEAPAFHPCVRHRRWAREGVLSFIPPDGDFELAQFNIIPARAAAKSLLATNTGASSAWEKDVPFTLSAKRHSAKESGGREWDFELRLTAKSGRTGPTCSEGVEVSFCVSPGQSLLSSQRGVSMSSMNVDARTMVSSRSSMHGISGGAGGGGAASVATGDDAGSWRFDAREGIVRWTVPRLGSLPGGVPGPSEVTLKGTVSVSAGGDSSASLSSPALAVAPKPSSLLVAFSLPLGAPTLSGVRVSSLQVGGVEYKVFKGVRGATRGRIEWRW